MTTLSHPASIAKWTGDGNEHISIPRLRELLQVQLETIEQDIGSSVNLEQLGRLKEGIDTTTKALIRTRFGAPVAVVVCSRPAAPDLMARSALLAEQVRAVLGAGLGDVVIRSLNCGYVDGRSYIILPWHPSPAQAGVRRVWARYRLRRPVLDWLHAATAAAAARDAGPANEEESYGRVLAYLAEQSFLSRDDAAAVDRARQRLADGSWRARHAVDHNDLWFGNVLLSRRELLEAAPRHPFVLIDWAGANPSGYGIFDLVRIARSMKLPARGLGRELVRHAAALGCELADTEGHLLAALGRLHRRIEYFPEEQYVRMFGQCRETLRAGLAAAGVR